jgi:hypothetical protein
MASYTLTNQADLYTKTMKKMAKYASQTCKYSANICRVIKDLDQAADNQSMG